MNTRANILAVPVFLILTPLLGVAFSLFLPFPIEVIVLLVALIPALLAGLLAAMTGGRKGLGAIEARPLMPTFLAPFAASIILTWLFVQSRGNLLMIILWHFGLNFFPMFLDGLSLEQSIWLQASVSLLVALILIISFGPGLKRGRKMQPVALEL